MEPHDLSQPERDALHEIELGIEHLHRAHGDLISFHHDIGRAMDHLDHGETLLRDADYPDLAATLRAEHLPRGVITGHGDSSLWSYELLENFESGFLNALVDYGNSVNEEVAGGLRHAAERKQEQEWTRRARRE